MTYEEFYNMVEENTRIAASTCKKNRYLRLGQCIYNLTYHSFPRECNKVPTYADPFFKDGNIYKFWDFLEKELVEE